MFSVQNDISATQTTGAAPQAAKTALSDGSDFAMFLRMLTTQMQNQNPLNPVEASDFAVQLATFSGVEQQIQTNQLLGKLADQMVFSDLASWLNKDVATNAPVPYAGAPLTLHAAPVADATQRELIISNTQGQELARVPVSAGQSDIVIDLAHDVPTALPHGSYQFTVEDFNASGSLSTTSAMHYAPVQEVRNINGQVLLVLEGGAQVNSSQITGIRGA
ncbi:flagellar hook capping FlgD N-terminal domain-containing protein [Roseinatronobacter sp. NSM]|uniref:flagellar hook capping FlgD N-terminal domain-containing protein n=1 Tax=Roseinatronobacter sp. NSM TaxID=3457785 RepID=UPI00403670BE